MTFADAPVIRGRSVSIGRAALGLITITASVKIVGFVEKQVIAYYFGVDVRVDSFFVALSVPIAIFMIVRELVEPAFLPLFVRHLDAARPERGWRLFVAVAAGILALTIPLAAAAWMCAESLAALLAPGFSDETQRLTAQLIRVMIVGGVLLALSSLTYITLNSYRRFALPASGDLVQKVAPVLFALLLAPQLGIFSFAFGVLVGSAGRLLLHTGGLARQLRWLDRPRGDSGEDLRRLSVLIAPLVLGVAFAQLTDLADNYFSSQVGAGAVAAKTYARKIAELPILLLPYALSVVLFPFLASLANRGDWDRMHDLLARTLRSLALVFAFLTVVTVLLAEPLVTLLLERGAFNEGARALTVWPLRLYGIGLVTFAIEAILVPFYYSLQDTRTPVALGILGVIVNVALTVALIGPLGVGGVALALTLSKTLKVMTLALLLRYKHFAFELSSVLACVLIVSVAAAAAAVGVGLFILIEPFPGPSASLLEQVAYLVFASLTAAVPFLGCVLLIRSPERLLALEGGRALLQLLRGSHN